MDAVLKPTILLSICVLVALLGVHFTNWAAFAFQSSLWYPYQLDFGEGIVWQQAIMLLRGDGYTPLDDEPHIVFHYPPVYHLIVGLLAQLTGDFLISGRLITLVSSLTAACLLVALVLRAVTRTQDVVGHAIALVVAVAVALLFTNHPVVARWSVVMRVDMLALALGLAGAWFGLRVPEKPGSVLLAALFFALSIYTKQTLLALPAATFTLLLLASPRAGLRGVAVTALIGFGSLLVLQIVTGGGFLTHVVGYNLNRIEISNAYVLVGIIRSSPILVGIGVAVGLVWSGRLAFQLTRNGFHATGVVLRDNPAVRIRTFAILFFLFCTILLPLSLKSGAADNYFIEWIAALVLLTGIALFEMTRAGAQRTMPFALLISVALLLHVKPPPRLGLASVAELDGLASLIAEADKPVISDEMVMVLRTGREVIWESAIHAELAALGRWDPEHFARRIRNGEFEFVATEGARDSYIFGRRYPAVVAEAIDDAYPAKRTYGRFVVHLRTDSAVPVDMEADQ